MTHGMKKTSTHLKVDNIARFFIVEPFSTIKDRELVNKQRGLVNKWGYLYVEGDINMVQALAGLHYLRIR